MVSAFHLHILIWASCWAPAHQNATWHHYSNVSRLSNLMSKSEWLFNNWEKQNKWNKHLKFLKEMFCVYSNMWLASRCNSGIRCCFRKRREWGTVDMVWPWRALFDLPEDLSSVVNTCGAAYAVCNSTPRISNTSYAHDVQTCRQRKHPHTFENTFLNWMNYKRMGILIFQYF